MGYTTDFEGTFKITPALSHVDKTFLSKLATTRRMARDTDKFGIEGEYYVDGPEYDMTADDGPRIINHSVPPKTQPGLWCQWKPSMDGSMLMWDGNEKFYNYVEWLKYIIAYLKPKGYKVNGSVKWYGEDREDIGIIDTKDNVVTTREGRFYYDEPLTN